MSLIIVSNKLNTTFLSETKSLSIIKYNDNGEYVGSFLSIISINLFAVSSFEFF